MEMNMKFTLALHTDNGVSYGVAVPDLPGCFSAGDTLDEAIEMAREAIDLHCEGLYEDDLDIPVAPPLSEHMAAPLLADAVWAIVEVDVEKYLSKPVRLNVSLPEGLVRSIDEYARVHHMSRSGFLAKAAQEAMKGQV
jgi:predicted RNase H-like HicB family nuclease